MPTIKFNERGDLLPFPYQYMGPQDDQIGDYECLYWWEHAIIQMVDGRWHLYDIQPLGANLTYSHVLMFECSIGEARQWEDVESQLRITRQPVYLLRYDPHLHHPMFECVATFSNYEEFDASGFNPCDPIRNPPYVHPKPDAEK